VADVDDDRAAGRIEIGLALGVPDRAALGADRDGQGWIERAMENV
jgi:hypothetical protein